jgi:hypothetical protein
MAINSLQDLAKEIEAARQIIETLGNLVADAARSAIIEVNNTSSRTLRRQPREGGHRHGSFQTPPKEEIGPFSTDAFASKSGGGLYGTTGSVFYNLDNEGTVFHVRWDIPFAGENVAQCNVAGPHADFYEWFATPTGGNKKVHLRYTFGEKVDFDDWDRPYSDWRICGKCKVLFFALDEGHCPAQPLGIVSRPSDSILRHLPGYPGPPATVTPVTPVTPTAGQPLFGKHEAAGDTFKLRVRPGPNREAGWRKCGRCKVLFYNGNETKGACPGHPPGHMAEADGPDFQLAFDMPRRPWQQHEWRVCDKCLGLFFLPHNADGVCPVGGNHHATHLNYVLDRVRA